MRGTAVYGGLVAIDHAIIADDLGNSQPVIAEDAVAAFVLGRTMCRPVAPHSDRCLVAPVG